MGKQNTRERSTDETPDRRPRGRTDDAGIERLRKQAGSIKADLARVAAAPLPSAYCKRRVEETVAALAAQGKPSVTPLVRHDLDVTWPREAIRVQLFNSENPAAMAISEVPATDAMLAGMFPKQMTEWLGAMVDAEVDDKNALAPTERQKREAELQERLLDIERQEAALVWRA